jgi:hypothetical protein
LKYTPRTKRCSKCREVKLTSEFWHMARSPTGLQGYCKACMRSRNKYKASGHRRRRYGLSEAAFQEMLTAQDYRCLICRRKRRLIVDHDHNSGAVRGLLCDRCNVGMGCLDDNPALLVRAAKYLLSR